MEFQRDEDKVEWDEDKLVINQKEHGVDLRDASLIFEHATLTGPIKGSEQEYGELRLRSLGEVDGTCYHVIHTERNDRIRMISAFKLSKGGKSYAKYRKKILESLEGDEKSR